MNGQVLITGGLGYLGGRVASYLRRTRPNLNIILTTRRKIESCPAWSKNFCVRCMNLLDKASIRDCVEDVETIVHLASVNENDSIKDPLHALDVNTRAVYDLLNLSCSAGVKRLIYFSTFHVYKPCGVERVTEDTPTRPTHPYAITHLAAEGIVEYFRRYKALNTMILRLSNGYGYPVDADVNRWSLVFNDLCRQIVQTKRIVLRSSGEQHRDFISLEDVARAVDHFMFMDAESWCDGLYNLGGECSMSIHEVAIRVSSVYRNIYGSNFVPIEIGMCDDSDPQEYPVNFSIDKLKATGFSLIGNMEKEIQETLNIAKMLCHD